MKYFKDQPASLIDPTALDADLIASDEISPASTRVNNCHKNEHSRSLGHPTGQVK